MPDLNSLPLSLGRSSSSNTNTAATTSAASTNMTGAASGGSPRLPRSPNTERRRSSLWTLSDGHASNSGGGTSGSQFPPSPFHQRAPSLGELHQELENEQEFQINRLLAQIRQQQAQIQQLQSQAPSAQSQSQSQSETTLPGVASNAYSEASTNVSTTAVASSTPGSSHPSSRVPSRSQSQVQAHYSQAQPVIATAQAPQPQQQQQQQQTGPTSASSSLSRESSHRRPASGAEGLSQRSSPSIRPHDGPVDWTMGHYGLVNRERDDLAFYQTETAMVQRENQMLKGRIRELERQIQELGLRGNSGDERDAQVVTSGD